MIYHVNWSRVNDNAAVMDNSNQANRKRIGFLSFGAWHPGGGMTHTGADALQQTVELAVAPSRSASTEPSCEFITLRASSLLRFRCWRRSGSRQSGSRSAPV